MTITEFKESRLFNKLLDNPDMVQEILAAHNIRTTVAPLGSDLAGMVYLSRFGHYYIVGNWILEQDAQQFVFLHELYHIVADAPKVAYAVRLDLSREELQADAAAEAAIIRQ